MNEHIMSRDRNTCESDAMPLVSAVLVTHNRLGLLKEALRSIREQSYDNIEIIVVDDASDDGTAEYLQSLDNIVTVLIDSEHSRGGNYARNCGIMAAHGDFIAFLDDDDEWLPLKIEKQVAELRDSQAVVVGCGRIFVLDGEPVREEGSLPFGDMSEAILYQIPFSTSTIMVRRSALLAVGCFDESLTHWQEYELEMRLCQYGEVACVNEPLVRYRVSSNEHSRLSNNLDKWEIAVMRIEEKHKTLISSANRNTRAMRKYMIAMDGAKRAESLGLYRKEREYLFRAFISRPSMKGLIKFILCKASRVPI